MKKASVLMKLRRADASELDVVADLWHESASSMDGASGPMASRDELRQRIDEELASGWDLHLAVCGGRIVAMLALKPHDAILDQIFVLPAEQGRGVGRLLLNLAKARMSDGFRLRTPASNKRAHRFYEKEGLNLISQGIHPRWGTPVRTYGWKVC